MAILRSSCCRNHAGSESELVIITGVLVAESFNHAGRESGPIITGPLVAESFNHAGSEPELVTITGVLVAEAFITASMTSSFLDVSVPDLRICHTDLKNTITWNI